MDHVPAGYDIVVGQPGILGAAPETASEKAHWVEDGAGQGAIKRFINPWESSHDFSFPEIFKAMVR